MEGAAALALRTVLRRVQQAAERSGRQASQQVRVVAVFLSHILSFLSDGSDQNRQTLR